MMRTHSYAIAARSGVIALAIIVSTEKASFAQAKEAPTKPPFQLDLTTPDGPAFVILGVAPSQIARPTTPAGLATSLLSSVQDSTGFIPNNYALEVAPYWLGRPQVGFNEYVDPTIRQSIAQTFSLSFATSRSAPGAPANNSDIAGGTRLAIWAGHGSTAFFKNLLKMLSHDPLIGALQLVVPEVTLVANPDPMFPNGGGVPTMMPWPDAVSTTAQWTEAITTNLNALSAGPAPIMDAATRTRAEAFLHLPTRANLKAWLLARLDQRMTAFSGFTADTDALLTKYGLKNDALKALEKIRPADVHALEVKIDAVYDNDDVLALTLLGAAQRPLAPPAAGALAVRVLKLVLPGYDAIATAAMADLAVVTRDVQAADKIRQGRILTVAAAIGSRVPDDAFDDARLLRWGVWASPAYRTDATHLEFVGVLKYVHRPALEGPALFDVGARAVKDFGRAALSGEYLQRIAHESGQNDTTTERTSINFEYKIAEKLYLTAAFGKDFADPAQGAQKGGLISIFGVNIGLASSASILAPQ
jgi:hypothetical protein